MIKTMTMTNIKIEHGTGIYVQELAGVTTVGDGLDPRGDKSPVAYIKEREIDINQSENNHQIRIVKKEETITIKEEYNSEEDFAVVASEMIASNFISLSRGKRPLQDSNSPEQSRYGSCSSKIKILTSPAIKTDATETQNVYSQEKFQRISDNLKRLQMGLSAQHITQIDLSSDSLPSIDDNNLSSILPRKKLKRKKILSKERKLLAAEKRAALDANYPIEIQILNRSNPFREISNEYQLLLLNAVETTVQDERVRGHLIKLGPCTYKRKTLIVRCTNNETVLFLENNIPLYNRLWHGADLFLMREQVFHKRYKVKVHLSTYNLTSDEFFKIIGKQNGFPSEFWSIMYMKNNTNGFFALIGVDVASYERIRESKGFVYFFFDRIMFELDQK